VRVWFSAVAIADVINALFAFYVATRNALTVPPNLNADQLDYYLYGGLQSGTSVGGTQTYSQMFDIRSGRRIRGEDRSLLFRVTNNEATAMQVGMEYRALMQKS